MIYPILIAQNQTSNLKPNKVTFGGTAYVVQKYVKPIEPKHVPMVEKLGEFFIGLKDIFKKQYKPLTTSSGALKVANTAEPIPEAVLDFGTLGSAKLVPKKFKLADVKLDLCHVEYNDTKKIHKFDVILNDSVKSPKRGDVFAFDTHRADKAPIRDYEVNVINTFFDKHSQDILSIIKKYQKKLS